MRLRSTLFSLKSVFNAFNGKETVVGCPSPVIRYVSYLKINSTCNRNTLQLNLSSPKRPPRGQKSVILSVVERFKQELMYGLSAQKGGR